LNYNSSKSNYKKILIQQFIETKTSAILICFVDARNVKLKLNCDRIHKNPSFKSKGFGSVAVSTLNANYISLYRYSGTENDCLTIVLLCLFIGNCQPARMHNYRRSDVFGDEWFWFCPNL